MSKNDIAVYHGLGSFKDESTIEINADGKTQTINGNNIIIAVAIFIIVVKTNSPSGLAGFLILEFNFKTLQTKITENKLNK